MPPAAPPAPWSGAHQPTHPPPTVKQPGHNTNCRRAHFSFWTGWRGGCPRRSMPTLIAPESVQSVQTQEGFVPAGFQNWLVRLNRH